MAAPSAADEGSRTWRDNKTTLSRRTAVAKSLWPVAQASLRLTGGRASQNADASGPKGEHTQRCWQPLVGHPLDQLQYLTNSSYLT